LQSVCQIVSFIEFQVDRAKPSKILLNLNEKELSIVFVFLLLTGYPPYPTTNTPYPTPYPSYPATGSSSTTPYPSFSGGYPPYPVTAGNTNSNPSYSSYPPVATPTPQASGTISEDHIRASLLSAVEDKVSTFYHSLISVDYVPHKTDSGR